MTEFASLPFNPADYFTFVLDQEIRDAGMPGGYCGLALHLTAEPNLNRLQQRLDLLVERFPKASAHIARQGNRYVWRPTGQRILLERHQCNPAEEISEETQHTLLEIFNRPESLPLTLHWIADKTGGTLLLNWIHPLLDARGAKIVLDFLASDQPERFQESASLLEEKLAQWSFWKKLQLIIKAKRHNHQTNDFQSCSPTETEHGSQTLKLKIRRFEAEQSKRIAALARQYTGLAGRTLYYLGCLMRAMEQAGPPAAKTGYCIPYAFNLRRQNAPTPVFGNHVGFLFAQASRKQVKTRQGLFEHLFSQYSQTIRDELDMAYLPLMWLGQWLTPSRYAKILRKQHSGNELSSVWFSDLGDLSWGEKGFLGVPVTQMLTLCWVTLPPGLALLVGQLNERLTLSYCYLSPAVDEAWLDTVIDRMDAELLESDED